MVQFIASVAATAHLPHGTGARSDCMLPVALLPLLLHACKHVLRHSLQSRGVNVGVVTKGIWVGSRA
jgi:hypothetical protein